MIIFRIALISLVLVCSGCVEPKDELPTLEDCENGYLPCVEDSTVCCEVTCPPGYYLGGQDSTECLSIECPPGYYLGGEDSTECLEVICPPGYYLAGPDSIECLEIQLDSTVIVNVEKVTTGFRIAWEQYQGSDFLGYQLLNDTLEVIYETGNITDTEFLAAELMEREIQTFTLKILINSGAILSMPATGLPNHRVIYYYNGEWLISNLDGSETHTAFPITYWTKIQEVEPLNALVYNSDNEVWKYDLTTCESTLLSFCFPINSQILIKPEAVYFYSGYDEEVSTISRYDYVTGQCEELLTLQNPIRSLDVGDNGNLFVLNLGAWRSRQISLWQRGNLLLRQITTDEYGKMEEVFLVDNNRKVFFDDGSGPGMGADYAIMDTTGAERQFLFSGGDDGWPMRLSPDRSKVIIYSTTYGGHRTYDFSTMTMTQGFDFFVFRWSMDNQHVYHTNWDEGELRRKLFNNGSRGEIITTHGPNPAFAISPGETYLIIKSENTDNSRLVQIGLDREIELDWLNKQITPKLILKEW